MSANPTYNTPAVPGQKLQQGMDISAVRRVWVWWHLLSLDAPTVAVVWCWFFAAAFGVRLPPTALITLALGTWCVYVADRLLDGWRSVDMTDLRDRHWFYLRHREPFMIAWIGAAIPLAYLILFRVQPAVRVDDIVLCLIGVGYFLFIHHRSEGDRFSKELFVGFLFAIATAVPTWTRLQANRGTLLVAVATFGSACWLNCVAIQTWEDAEARCGVMRNDFATEGANRLRVQKILATHHRLTEFLGNHLKAFALAIGVLALSLGGLTGWRFVWPLFIAVAASSLVFVALIHRSVRFSALSLRILADGALLTPLLFIYYVR